MGTDPTLDPLFRLTGLSTKDLADTLASNPRAYMALKGAVAEKHLALHLSNLLQLGAISSFRCGSGDFEKDFYLSIPGSRRELVIECKNVQVINVNTTSSRREYIKFLLKNQYLENQEFNLDRIESASSVELKEIWEGLSLNLRESGLPRYSFSRYISKIGDKPSLRSGDTKAYLSAFNDHPITIDFQRTRNSRDDDKVDSKANRFYKSDEVDVVAACLFSRTLEWEFVFCATSTFERHRQYADRYSNGVKVTPADWKASLLEALAK